MLRFEIYMWKYDTMIFAVIIVIVTVYKFKRAFFFLLGDLFK